MLAEHVRNLRIARLQDLAGVEERMPTTQDRRKGQPRGTTTDNDDRAILRCAQVDVTNTNDVARPLVASLLDESAPLMASPLQPAPRPNKIHQH